MTNDLIKSHAIGFDEGYHKALNDLFDRLYLEEKTLNVALRELQEKNRYWAGKYLFDIEDRLDD